MEFQIISEIVKLRSSSASPRIKQTRENCETTFVIFINLRCSKNSTLQSPQAQSEMQKSWKEFAWKNKFVLRDFRIMVEQLREIHLWHPILWILRSRKRLHFSNRFFCCLCERLILLPSRVYSILCIEIWEMWKPLWNSQQKVILFAGKLNISHQ